MKKAIVALVLASLFSLIACNKKTQAENDQATIATIQQLVAKGEATIVDVRNGDEFAEGHTAGSVNIPLDSVEGALTTLKQYQNIVLVCRTGKRSTEATAILERNGFANVYNGKAWDTLNESLK